MRIAMVNWSSRRVGGAETYLEAVISDLAAAGHAVSLWHECARPPSRPAMELPPDTPRWDASALGVDAAIEQMRLWKPDVTLTHGVLDPAMHARVMPVAPAVYFAHTYYGTCISGEKTWKSPSPVPCSRTLGPPCLLHYYPHRCGGLSPITMIRDYRRQRSALETLREYADLVVASSQMRAEYLAHGFAPDRVHVAPYYVAPSELGNPADDVTLVDRAPGLASGIDDGRTSVELLFIGRMDILKGGEFLLGALPRVVESLGARVRLTLIGDGPARARWEAGAARMREADSRLTIVFAGWLQRPEILEHLRSSHLLVVPSVWPEPFGIVGLEAGTQGVPVVAFDVGGIREWLRDGINGRIASGDRPTTAGLADAIVRTLQPPGQHREMRLSARSLVREFTATRHVTTLVQVLASAAARASGGSLNIASVSARPLRKSGR